MAVLAVYRYEVKPGRMSAFLAKLNEAADSRFDGGATPKSIRLFRSTVPGPDTGPVILVIEYADMATFGARAAFENENHEWKRLFEAKPDSPETLLSVELLSEVSG
jgi:hypothetical protein